MDQLWHALLIGIMVLFFITSLFYECLCLISRFISKWTLTPRQLLYVMVMGIFIAHGIAIFIYAVIYWTLIHYTALSDLSGNVEKHFLTYLYFSATTYSSLGIGDVYPEGALRFLAGIQAINGLILITWSGTFTFFSTQKMWEIHGIEPQLSRIKCSD